MWILGSHLLLFLKRFWINNLQSKCKLFYVLKFFLEEDLGRLWIELPSVKIKRRIWRIYFKPSSPFSQSCWGKKTLCSLDRKEGWVGNNHHNPVGSSKQLLCWGIKWRWKHKSKQEDCLESKENLSPHGGERGLTSQEMERGPCELWIQLNEI